MKKLLIIASFFLSLNASAQKDSTQKDTVCILHLNEVNEIAGYIQAQMSGKVDVKNQTWQTVIQLLYGKLQIVDVPKKQQPKK